MTFVEYPQNYGVSSTIAMRICTIQDFQISGEAQVQISKIVPPRLFTTPGGGPGGEKGNVGKT